MMAFLPTHWRIFAIAWIFLAVRLLRHGQCHLASGTEQRICKSAFHREQTTGLHAHFWRPSPGLPVPLEAEPVSVRVLSRSLVTLAQDSLPDSPDPTGLLTLARLFLVQRRDGIALSLGKCRADRWRYSPALPSRVRHAAECLICGSSPEPLHSQD